ncbi:unnamed protein product [Cuscuta campestris]|uniref:DYW domain-containing protein n=1 Tax=Cuscuta campestris TaxID=132261 RepID=A0A484N7M4_9ASTE|nr:unnamed protein product [Cuscuta campestris]VFQ97344.1 unnamed protein product [Cuscuta campestris]
MFRGAATLAASQTSSTYNRTFSHIFQDCSSQRALFAGKQAHALMITSGFVPTVFVTNCLIQLYINCSCLHYADKVFDIMPQRDTVTWNAMISRYTMVGDLRKAEMAFGFMPNRDVISWNSMMSGYLQNGDHEKAVEVFVEMGKEDVAFDRTTFSVALKIISALDDLGLGLQVHGLVTKMSFNMDVTVGTAIVDMYSKCKRLDEAMCFFTEMSEKNSVSWSALIAGHVQNNQLVEGLELFKKMQNQELSVCQSTYASLFRSCAGLSYLSFGCQLHGHTLKTNFASDFIVGTSILDMYAKCSKLTEARKVFDLLPFRTLQSYNAMIVGYARGNKKFEALRLFQTLIKSGLGYNEIALSGVFSACAGAKALSEGVQFHALVIKTPFQSNISVANSVLDMYGKCEAPNEARRQFDEMEFRDAVSWNAIIAACEKNGLTEETLMLFFSMIQSKMEPDEFTYGSVLKVCAAKQALQRGMEIHSRILKSGLGFHSFIGSSLVDMYCKCGKLKEAERLHYRMDEQTIVSWNAIISGFSMHERSEEAQIFFSKMLCEDGVKPDNFTYATVLDICANMATVGLGKQIHAQIMKQDLLSDAYIISTLVDMYSKCGDLHDAKLAFEKAPKKDLVTWNAIICGSAQHGLAEDALQIFGRMEQAGILPNHSTFLAVLRACVHMGLVEKGLSYFNMMEKYGLEHQMEHFSCMVEILGRAGRASDALKLIRDMPFMADDVTWRTLLSTCKMNVNVEVAEVAANSLLQIDPMDSSTYVLLCNVYANAGMWERVAGIRKEMRFGCLKKEPGCSWIEVNSEVHMFYVGDKAHPRCTDIYTNLDLLITEMKLAGTGYELGL